MEYLGLEAASRPSRARSRRRPTHLDGSYMRLGRTFDLTVDTAAQAPTLRGPVRVVDRGRVRPRARRGPHGRRGRLDDPGRPRRQHDERRTAAVRPGFLLDLHPKLLALPDAWHPCIPTGSTGEWNSFTGESGGWVPVELRPERLRREQVEIVVSYVTDPNTGGLGVIVDDTRLDDDGGAARPRASRGGSARGPCSGARRGASRRRSTGNAPSGSAARHAGVVTEDTVLLGFGIEQLDGPAAQARVVGDALRLLGVRTRR